uniref:peptidyl-tRNA hydrolase n=1 Tax=Blastobotrys adeninivorans TaxID=409370 RepID=A0A060T3W3_BLAAD
MSTQYWRLAITCLVSGLAGYYFGSQSHRGYSDDEDEVDASPGAFADSQEECKLVLVVRSDLKMGKGKVAAQCSHATLACYKSLARSDPALLNRWESTGQAKVTLQCGDEEEMKLLQAMAMSLNLTARVIHDAGRTQIAAGSATVLGIGPAPKSAVDQVTGSLKLY